MRDAKEKREKKMEHEILGVREGTAPYRKPQSLNYALLPQCGNMMG